MDELISREATIKRIHEVYCASCDSYHGIRCRVCGTGDAIDIIGDAPAADVAPVVRCKDCKYLVNATVNANGFLICDISDMEIAPDDFCSYGEPKEGTHADDHD